MRADRLVSLLLLLQARGRMTARQLAGELEVTLRTVYRDVAALQAAGVPVYGRAGPDGGYGLLDGYHTRLTGLTGTEAAALFLAGLPGPAAELGLGAVATTAALKLMAALPASLRTRAGQAAARFHLDAPGWYREAEPVPHLAGIATAVWDARAVRVRYRRWKAPEEVTRVLRPYGLVLKAGRWYLVAGHDDPGGHGDRVATYRVAQILDLAVLDEPIHPPDGFDLPGYWRGYLAEFDARRYSGEAVIRLSPAGRDRAGHLFDAAAARALDRTASVPDAGGWIRAVVPIESVAHAAGELLRLGAEVEVLAPDVLRDRIAATVAALGRIYAGGSATPE